jgi:hypothetical protein
MVSEIGEWAVGCIKAFYQEGVISFKARPASRALLLRLYRFVTVTAIGSHHTRNSFLWSLTVPFSGQIELGLEAERLLISLRDPSLRLG